MGLGHHRRSRAIGERPSVRLELEGRSALGHSDSRSDDGARRRSRCTRAEPWGHVLVALAIGGRSCHAREGHGRRTGPHRCAIARERRDGVSSQGRGSRSRVGELLGPGCLRAGLVGSASHSGARGVRPGGPAPPRNARLLPQMARTGPDGPGRPTRSRPVSPCPVRPCGRLSRPVFCPMPSKRGPP